MKISIKDDLNLNVNKRNLEIFLGSYEELEKQIVFVFKDDKDNKNEERKCKEINNENDDNKMIMKNLFFRNCLFKQKNLILKFFLLF